MAIEIVFRSDLLLLYALALEEAWPRDSNNNPKRPEAHQRDIDFFMKRIKKEYKIPEGLRW